VTSDFLPDDVSARAIASPPPLARRRLITAGVMLAMFMSAVESSIVSPAMPTIVATLSGFKIFTWVFAAYLAAQATSIPVYGRLADVHGRKRVFCIGIAIFLIGSALCGFARSMEALIGFRLLQGLGAGAILPIGSTIIADIYSPADRARMQGYLSSVWAVSAITGPVLGAFIVQHLSWSLIFWINLPVGAVTMPLLAIFLRESQDAHRRRIDYGGTVLLVVASAALLIVLNQATELGPTLFWIMLTVAVSGVVLLIRHELHAEEPMLRLDLWKNRFIAVGNLGSMIVGAIMMGIVAFLPTYVQGAMGRSPVVAGFALTAMSVGWSSASVLASRVMLRASYRVAALLGGLSMVLGNGLLLMLTPKAGPILAGAGALLVGMGMGFCTTPFIVSTQSAVGRADRGTATSVVVFMRFVGQSLGVALFGAVFNHVLFADPSINTDMVNRLMEPALRQTLDVETTARLAIEISAALHDVYLIGLVLGFIALAITTALPPGHSPHAERDQ
jgi:EmrB/QacA subfamily drug resistance transporter